MRGYGPCLNKSKKQTKAFKQFTLGCPIGQGGMTATYEATQGGSGYFRKRATSARFFVFRACHLGLSVSG